MYPTTVHLCHLSLSLSAQTNQNQLIPLGSILASAEIMSATISLPIQRVRHVYIYIRTRDHREQTASNKARETMEYEFTMLCVT